LKQKEARSSAGASRLTDTGLNNGSEAASAYITMDDSLLHDRGWTFAQNDGGKTHGLSQHRDSV
jgi:hypothetical protein